MTGKTTVPTFAIVGQPNEGKTTTIATLAEDDRASIGPNPGTTRTRVRYPVKVDNHEIMVLFDTPGFENSGACLEWLRAYDGGGNAAEAFVSAPSHKELYPEECEILRTLADGAAAIYVVDGDREPRDPDRQQAEILRLCGVARIGIINSKKGHGTYVPKWKALMLADFNTLREFNACQAAFSDRIKLLDAIKNIVPDWEVSMQKVIDDLAGAWEERLENSAEAMLGIMKQIIKFRSSERFDSADSRKKAKSTTKRKVEEEVRSAEQAFRAKIRGFFRHHDDHWELPPHLKADIFSSDVWHCLGLSKKKLSLAAALASAALGGMVDVAVGGASLGIVALVSGAVGGIGAVCFADHAVRFKLPKMKLGPLSIPGMPLGGTFVEAGIERRSKLPGILVDRMLLFILDAASWAHGRREEGTKNKATASDKENGGIIDSWEKGDEIKIMAAIEVWYRLAEGKQFPATDVDDAENGFRDAISRFLKERTMGKAKGQDFLVPVK